MGELVATHKYRQTIPSKHRYSLDTRIWWLWNQKFGTVQSVWVNSKDLLDHTAATLYLQAVMGNDLDAISQIMQRIEGSMMSDVQLLEHEKNSNLRV